MKEIRLSRSDITLVDDEDFEYLNQWDYLYFVNKYICAVIIKYLSLYCINLIYYENTNR